VCRKKYTKQSKTIYETNSQKKKQYSQFAEIAKGIYIYMHNPDFIFSKTFE